jgi:hypothetical protein
MPQYKLKLTNKILIANLLIKRTCCHIGNQKIAKLAIKNAHCLENTSGEFLLQCSHYTIMCHDRVKTRIISDVYYIA